MSYIYTNPVQIYTLCAMKSVHSVCFSIHLRCSMELGQRRRGCAEAHKRVSLSGLWSKASINCSQCVELFSSFFRDSNSALPLDRAYFSSLLICLLSRAKPEIQRKKETVLKPNVRPRYTILQKEESNTVTGQTGKELSYKSLRVSHIFSLRSS